MKDDFNVFMWAWVVGTCWIVFAFYLYWNF